MGTQRRKPVLLEYRKNVGHVLMHVSCLSSKYYRVPSTTEERRSTFQWGEGREAAVIWCHKKGTPKERQE